MKKIILLLSIVLSFLNSYSQLKVKANGTVKIGSGSGNPDAGDLQVVQNSNANIRAFSTTASAARIWALNSLSSYGFGISNTGLGSIFNNINAASPSNIITFNSTGNIGIAQNPSSTFKLALTGSAVCTGVWQSSDRKLKTNIKPLTFELNDLYNLVGVSFIYKSDSLNYFENPHMPQTNYGFIAQDVQLLFPDLVRENISDSSKTLCVNYDGLIPLMLEALKDQNNKINALKVELDSLKGLSTSTIEFFGNTIKENSIAQNSPNPFQNNTTIHYSLNPNIKNAEILIYTNEGKQILSFKNLSKGEGMINIEGSELKAGVYLYTLIVDGYSVDTKQMILTK